MVAPVLNSITWTSTSGTVSSGGIIYANVGDKITIVYNFASSAAMHQGDQIKLNNGKFAQVDLSTNQTKAVAFIYTVAAGDNIASLLQTDTKVYDGRATPVAYASTSYDTTGVTSSAPTSTITVDTTTPLAPVITGFAPDTGTTGDHLTKSTSLTISGTAEANSTVTLLQNGVPAGTTTADGSGAWSITDPNTLANGNTYNFTATATDRAGNVSSASSTFSATVDTVAPVVTNATATDGTVPIGGTAVFTLTVDGSVIINGTPTLALSNGATATYDAASSTTTTLVFDYVVARGDPASSDLAVTSVSGVTDAAGNALVYSGDPTGTTDVLCFCKGTLIAAPDGEIPVERLQVGDLVSTRTGAAQPITWIGIGRVLVTRGRPNAATPVIVRKDALADNVPHQDLYVTKGHSLFVDGVLIPAEFLVNHRSIVWDDRAQEVDVYHIELGRHDVILANGAAAESYRDDGNRWLFQNTNAGWWQPAAEPYAPILTGGPVVDAIWQRLLSRAGGAVPVDTTVEPDLHLIVDGRRISPRRRRNGVYFFRAPRRPAEVRVVSRVAVPSHLGHARDPRSLGVALRQILIWQGSRLRISEAADLSRYPGFYPVEGDQGFSWTDGDAVLPPALFEGMKEGPCELHLRVGCTARYPAKEAARAAA